MVTPADLVTLQQQLRQEVADIFQQLRVETNEAISSRMDMMNSVSAALQKVSSKSESKPYRISDLIPRNWEGGNEKRRIPKIHVRLALVDAGVVRSRRTDACHG